MWHGDWGWGAWLVMSLSMGAFWWLVIWLFLNLARTNQDDGARREGTADEILAARLARGEIDEDDFRRRSAALHGEPDAGTSPKAGTR